MKQILYKLFEHQYLGRDEARTILQNIAQGKYNDVQVASLITVFLMRNISVEELCGFRDALLEMRIPVDLSEFAPIDISGKSGMTILKAIVSGETDPVVLSELAEGRARDKIPEMQKSLQGRISEHQQKMLKHQLGHIESLTALIMDLDADIKKKQNP